MWEYDERDDAAYEEIDPIRDFVGHHGVPGDARRMGLDRNTEEGAMIAMVAALDPAKRSHRLVAWLLLMAFVLPLLLGMAQELF